MYISCVSGGLAAIGETGRFRVVADGRPSTHGPPLSSGRAARDREPFRPLTRVESGDGRDHRGGGRVPNRFQADHQAVATAVRDALTLAGRSHLPTQPARDLASSSATVRELPGGFGRYTWQTSWAVHMDGSAACAGVRSQLGVYLTGAIAPADRAVVVGHLGSCKDCRAELAGLAALPGLLRRAWARAAAESPGLDDAGPDDAGPDDAGLNDTGLNDAGPDDTGPDDTGPDGAGGRALG
jgi:hypothetical protein